LNPSCTPRVACICNVFISSKHISKHQKLSQAKPRSKPGSTKTQSTGDNSKKNEADKPIRQRSLTYYYCPENPKYSGAVMSAVGKVLEGVKPLEAVEAHRVFVEDLEDQLKSYGLVLPVKLNPSIDFGNGQ